MLLRFNGMCALAIFDAQSSEMFLARDRFGIKPLLYAVRPERFVFASEHRALVQSGMIQTTIDTDGARRLMLDAFSVEGSERTLSREVYRLEAGHFMWLRDGKRTIGRWWHCVTSMSDRNDMSR
jgi:asparagine synthase (glutamine-hydrolysing)